MKKYLVGMSTLMLALGVSANDVNGNLYDYNYSDPRVAEFTSILEATGLFDSPQPTIHVDKGGPSYHLNFDKCLARNSKGEIIYKKGVEWTHALEISLPGRDSESNVWVSHHADRKDYVIYGDTLVERLALKTMNPLQIKGIDIAYKFGRANAKVLIKAKEGFEKMIAQKASPYPHRDEKRISKAGIIKFIKQNIKDPCDNGLGYSK